MKKNWWGELEFFFVIVKFDFQGEFRGYVWVVDIYLGVSSIKMEFKVLGVGEIIQRESVNKGFKLSLEVFQYLEVR